MNNTTKKIYSGMEIPTTISTDERIFRIKTFNSDMILCNLDIAQKLIKADECYKLWHYWNHSFEIIGKKEVLDMPLK